VPITYGTSHLALVHRARLAAGQTLLVLGASGGVGTTAVQVGVLWEAGGGGEVGGKQHAST
jgi:NADPH2:quinone reductase